MPLPVSLLFFCGFIIGGIHQWNVQFCDVPRLLILGFVKKV